MSPYSPSQGPKKVIIFDFDGVLADSFDTFYPLLRDTMKRIGLSLTSSQYRDLFIGNVHQGLKNFIGDDNKYEAAMEFRNSNYDKYYYDKRRKAKLFPGAARFLKEISKNYVLTVASSGREDNIKNLLEENNIKNLFSLILANSAISKEGMINEISNKFNTEPRETIMITDTVGDVKIAKKLCLKTIAVTWGFHNSAMLKNSKPHKLVRNFNELHNLLEE